MITIILSPSQQKWNKCLRGDSETDHCQAIAQKVFEMLQNYDCSVHLIPVVDGTERDTLNHVVNTSNAICTHKPIGDRHYHLDIHTDAGGYSKGASGFYVSEYGKSFIIDVWREVCKLNPENGCVSKRDDLYVLNSTVAMSGLIELCFHDTKEGAELIHNKIDQFAEAIVRGIVNNLGISRKTCDTHWAEESFQKLIAHGIEIHERRFDDPIRRGEVFVLLAQLLK